MAASRTALLLLPEAPPAPRSAREPAAPAGPGVGRGDVLLTGAIATVGLLPVVCDGLGIGQWGAGTLGLGVAVAALAARALWGFAAAPGGGPRAPRA